MSGIFSCGKFYENADLRCGRCGTSVYEIPNREGIYRCFKCPADMEIEETKPQDPYYLPRVMVAAPQDGITINGELEYLLTNEGTPMIFESQAAAEVFLLQNGYHEEDLPFFHFVEHEDDSAEVTA